ncbi:hypothetical protein [Flavobacterium sp. 3HN19-14]|uniref:hypothetical protein n=1 Tax=Flavobacterium sp. 3HN19-14 TaxID=3448133 RepID=UPI003EDE935C
MKKFPLLPLLFVSIFAVSCSETNVIREDVIIDETPDAPAVSGQFQKRVLIEDYTGTWCGNCTRVAYGIDQAKAISDRVVSVAIHSGDDPYDFEQIGR